MLTTSYLQSTDDRAYPVRSLAVPGAAILDACAVDASYGQVLLLQSDGGIRGADLDLGTITQLCTVDLPELSNGEDDSPFDPAAWRLHANRSGTFCAIVVDRGHKGIVVETASGRITMVLDGGDYYGYTVPFSACFLHVDGRDIFVHRSDWNRLDAADPATGYSLTERHIAPQEESGPNPPHYLDYFHGRLRPSRDGTRILDNGWVWHPVSIPRIWSVAEWIHTNPWESEDGASLVQLAMRDDWNMPACWIDDDRIAIWGAVSRNEELEQTGLRPGVEICEAASNDRASDEQWPIEIDEVPRELFSDGKRLFIAGEAGTIGWDIVSRSEIFHLPGFSARLHDAERGILIAIGETTIIALSLPWSTMDREQASPS